jgi:pyridoxamine 5'-phosphate oxidase
MESHDPFTQFSAWLHDARHDARIAEPTAMVLATAQDGQPSARVVLLKEMDAQGFVFYSNRLSHKGRELAGNPQAALCFHWMPLHRQVRVRGRVHEVSDAEADAYFASRPRGSQIGAWASEQSAPLDSREALMARVAELEARFEGQDVPRPPHWGGWRLVPHDIEFWQEGEFRLHDRFVFTRAGDGWSRQRLNP